MNMTKSLWHPFLTRRVDLLFACFLVSTDRIRVFCYETVEIFCSVYLIWKVAHSWTEYKQQYMTE